MGQLFFIKKECLGYCLSTRISSYRRRIIYSKLPSAFVYPERYLPLVGK